MIASPLTAHSVAECYLFLRIAPCGGCKQPTLRPDTDLTRKSDSWEIDARCARCSERTTFQFAIDPPPTRESAASKEINPTSAPSKLIDLHGWLALFKEILTASGREKDKDVGRELVAEAAACLDEALKFYNGENDVPPESAFFTDAGQSGFSKTPDRYLRSYWLERRLMLPVPLPEDVATSQNRRRWWQFWRSRS